MSYNEDLISAPPLAPVVPASSEATDAPFQRPGPDVLSETIPVVFIGRNRTGLWVARDAEAKFGGLFWRERAALDFARTSAAPHPCAIVFLQTCFELDMPNQGNPLLTSLAAVTHLLIHESHRLIDAGRRLLAL